MSMNLEDLFNGKTDEEILKEIRKRKLTEIENKIEKEKKDHDVAVLLGEDLIERIEKAVEDAKKSEEIERTKKREAAASNSDEDDEEDKDNIDNEEEPAIEEDDWYTEGIDTGI